MTQGRTKSRRANGDWLEFMKREMMTETVKRCPWLILDDPLYVKYHDREWGVPVRKDPKIFEFLVLEAFQAGLSWRTVLHKRENFRRH